MASPNWFRTLLKKSFSSRFLMARATRLPVLGKIMEHGLFGGDDILYLPSDRVVSINQDLEGRNDMAVPSQVVKHFVEQAGRLFIMNSCICRDASSCRDYPVDLGCLFMGEAVKDINPDFGKPVTKQQALDHLDKCAQAGLVHLIGRNKLDSIWLNVRPKERLLTVCHCCPCCCLWKILPDVSGSIASKVTAMPGVNVRVTEKCEGCGACTKNVCFAGAISLSDGKARISDACRGCGRCVEVCPAQAIEMSVDLESSLKQAIDRISPLVDVG